MLYYDTEETKPNNEAQEKNLGKRKVVINTVSKLYVKLLNIYATQYDNFSEDYKKEINVLNRPELFILVKRISTKATTRRWLRSKIRARRNYSWKKRIKSPKKKNNMTGWKILTASKLSTTLPILLVQIKAGNNSYKSKIEIRKIFNLLYQHNKTTKKVCNNVIKSLK